MRRYVMNNQIGIINNNELEGSCEFKLDVNETTLTKDQIGELVNMLSKGMLKVFGDWTLSDEEPIDWFHPQEDDFFGNSGGKGDFYDEEF